MREEKIHRIEVHIAGICFSSDKILVMKRSPSRKLYPNLWECGGGQVEAGENFDEAVIRQMKEEAGIIVKPITTLKTYEILTPNSKQKKIPGLRFVCKLLGFVNGKCPQISKEHTEWRWLLVSKLDEFEFIPGVKDDIRLAYSQMSKI